MALAARRARFCGGTGPTGLVVLGLIVTLLSGCAAPDLSGPSTTASIAKPAAQPSTATGGISAPTDTQDAVSAVPDAQQRPGTVTGEARIGLMLPLSAEGGAGHVARAMKQAAELALFELDAAALKLTVKDDRGTPEGAAAAASELIAERVELIAGPLLSRSVAMAAEPARRAGVPIVAFSNDRTVAGRGVYLLSFLAELEVDRIVSYAVAQGRRRIAALVPGDAYGSLAAAALREAASRHGAIVVAIEVATTDANGFLEPARRIAELARGVDAAQPGLDAVFIAGGPEAVPSLGPLLAHVGIDTQRVKLIGTGGWDGPHAGRDPLLVGAWFAGPDPRGFAAFAERYAKAYGGPPPRIAGLAYEAMVVAASLASGAPGQRYTPATLTRPGGFAGIDSVVRLTVDGLSHRGLAVFEVQKSASIVIEAAPNELSGTRVSAAPGPTD